MKNVLILKLVILSQAFLLSCNKNRQDDEVIQSHLKSLVDSGLFLLNTYW